MSCRFVSCRCRVVACTECSRESKVDTSAPVVEVVESDESVGGTRHVRRRKVHVVEAEPAANAVAYADSASKPPTVSLRSFAKFAAKMLHGSPARRSATKLEPFRFNHKIEVRALLEVPPRCTVAVRSC